MNIKLKSLRIAREFRIPSCKINMVKVKNEGFW